MARDGKLRLPKHFRRRRIAVEGLEAPLPEGWTEHYDEASDRDYYHKVSTGETVWLHPLDAHYKELAMSEKAKKAKTQQDDDSP